MKKTGKIRVGVLFGGRSGEHEVSLSSTRGILGAIDRERYTPVPIGITKSGRWFMAQDAMSMLESGADVDVEVIDAPLVPLDTAGEISPIHGLDVIFPVLHGPYGEDGTVQGMLELMGLPYVGAGVAASAVGMDKVLCKAVFSAHGFPVLPYLALGRKEWDAAPDRVVGRIEGCLRYPVFVKPANLGSSVGVTKAHDRDELYEGLAEAALYDRKMLVEQGIDAREIEVSVLGNDEPEASVPGEIIPSREFYSYAAKYIDDASELLIPAPISEEQTEMVRSVAVAAYRSVDCAGMARVDFLMEKESGWVYLNELNTIPGFTPISMYPKLWEASGVSYTELISRLLELALERHADKARSHTTFDVSRAE